MMEQDVVARTVGAMIRLDPSLKGRESQLAVIVVTSFAEYLKERGEMLAPQRAANSKRGATMHRDPVVERALTEMLQVEPSLKGQELAIRGVIARALAAYSKEQGPPPGSMLSAR